MHNLIIGMTGSGKSSLAKMIIRELKRRDKNVAVLDPMGDPEYAADFTSKNPDEFLRFARANRDFYLFIDEAGQAIGRYNEPMQWLVTTARHCGHSSTIITQGMTQLPPIVRDQCGTVYAFTCAASNFEMLAEKFSEKSLREVPRLERYEFLAVSGFSPLKKFKISLDNGLLSCSNLDV